jgi:hypothetical protein
MGRPDLMFQVRRLLPQTVHAALADRFASAEL